MKVRVNIVVAGMIGLMAATSADAADELEAGLTLTIAAHEIYDENLYRLPDDEGPSSTDPGASRDDYLSRVSLGIEQQWQWSRQTLLVDVDANRNVYRYNDDLDNTSAAARAAWQWQVGRMAGTIAGEYTQALANFANTRFLGRDMVDTVGAMWKLGFKLGPQWSLVASGRHADTEHSAAVRSFDNSSTDSAALGLQFTTSSENEIALGYQATRADFEHQATLNGVRFDRNYHERGANLRVHYAWSEKTAFEGKVGYLEREYPVTAGIARGSFDGAVWDAAIQWQPTIRIGVDINGWRKLRAYLDAESDYFVSEGASILSTWHPSDRIGISLEAGYETQEYLGQGVNLLTEDGRRDRVRSQKLSVSYRALRKLHLELSGRIEDRGSNRDSLQYDSRVASFGVRWEY
jgi:hypothetical protein